MNKSLYVKARNLLYPGYSECSKCGGNWGWKKNATHATSKSSGVFLFCEECDKVVTLEERWKALDAWKAESIRQVYVYCRFDSMIKIQKAISDIENTEFEEFPRN